MSKDTGVRPLNAQLNDNLDGGIDYAIRVVNDVASSIQASLDALQNQAAAQNSDATNHVMSSSLAFTSSSVSDFLNLSKALLRVGSAQEYFEIQNAFFRNRAAATRDHIKQLSDVFAPPQ